jgi:site-specific DNA recombinase
MSTDNQPPGGRHDADLIEQPETARLARAVVYLRVSTKEQAERGGGAEGFSIPAQREACLRKAASLGADVVEEFIDAGESAKTARRPELQRLLTYLLDGAVQFVIVHKVDRLARNRVDDVEINVAIRKTGATLVSCTENIDETPSGALMHGIMSSIAEFYSKNLANEVIKGSVQKAKSGGTVGKAPTGYVNVRKIENGREIRTVTIDPERGPLMTWAFEAYAAGDWSIRTLLEELTRRGLTTTATAQMPSRPLVISHFLRLLRHPYYKGIVRYRGVEYPGSHTPLVTDEIWEAVQQRLSAGNTAGDKHHQHYHYLKGSVFCGECGERLIITMSKNRHGTVYPYFICIGRQMKRSDCKQKAVLIDVVECLVEQHYADVQLPSEAAGRVRDALLTQLASQQANAEHDKGFQQQRLHRLTTERKKLLEAFYNDSVPADLLKAEQARITSEMEHAKRRLLALSAEFDVIETNLNVAIEFAKRCQQAYLSGTPKVRRELNQAIFEKLYVHEEREVTSEMVEPFRMLMGAEVRAATELGAIRILSDAETSAEVAELTDKTTNPLHLAGVGGLNMIYLVGVEGLEPPTSAM